MKNKITLLLLLLLLSFLIGGGFFYYFKKENFQSGVKGQEDDHCHLSFSNRNSVYDGIEQTSVVSVDAIKTRRYPFSIENTTNVYNSDSPMLCSGNRLGTNIGKI
jgi:hypothetical protein